MWLLWWLLLEHHLAALKVLLWVHASAMDTLMFMQSYEYAVLCLYSADAMLMRRGGNSIHVVRT